MNKIDSKKTTKNRILVKAVICPDCSTVVDLRKRDWTMRTLHCPTCHRILEIQTPVGWVEYTNLDSIGGVA